MARTNPGDLVVLCVDKHPTVIGELENITSQAQAGAHSGEAAGDPDMHPQEMQDAAQVSGNEAAASVERHPPEVAGSPQPDRPVSVRG